MEDRATGVKRLTADLHWLSRALQLKSQRYTYANRVQHLGKQPVNASLTYIISCSLSQLLFSDQSYHEWKEVEDWEADRRKQYPEKLSIAICLTELRIVQAKDTNNRKVMIDAPSRGLAFDKRAQPAAQPSGYLPNSAQFLTTREADGACPTLERIEFRGLRGKNNASTVAGPTSMKTRDLTRANHTRSRAIYYGISRASSAGKR